MAADGICFDVYYWPKQRQTGQNGCQAFVDTRLAVFQIGLVKLQTKHVPKSQTVLSPLLCAPSRVVFWLLKLCPHNQSQCISSCLTCAREESKWSINRYSLVYHDCKRFATEKVNGPSDLLTPFWQSFRRISQETPGETFLTVKSFCIKILRHMFWLGCLKWIWSGVVRLFPWRKCPTCNFKQQQQLFSLKEKVWNKKL